MHSPLDSCSFLSRQKTESPVDGIYDRIAKNAFVFATPCNIHSSVLKRKQLPKNISMFTLLNSERID